MSDRRDPYRERGSEHQWMLLIFALIALGILAYGLQLGSSGQPDPSRSIQPSLLTYDPTLVALQKTALVPTPTRIPVDTPTPKIIMVTITPSPTSQLDYCDVVDNETPCALPPRARVHPDTGARMLDGGDAETGIPDDVPED